MLRSSERGLIQSERGKAFGLPWPELNDGLFYNDVVSASDSGLFFQYSFIVICSATSVGIKGCNLK